MMEHQEQTNDGRRVADDGTSGTDQQRQFRNRPMAAGG